MSNGATAAAHGIPQLVEQLAAAGLDLSLIELREVLWLAERLPQLSCPVTTQQPQAAPPPPVVEPTEPPVEPPPECPEDTRESWRQRTRVIVEDEPETTRYYAPASRERGKTASVVRVRGVRALPNADLLTRSLRPLARKRATWREAVFDDEATVTAFAETGLLVPHWRQGRGKWFDLALVAEESPSMHLWNGVVDEFESLLRHLGAFRRLTRWSLAYRDERLWLTSGSRLTHHAGELVHREGRQLVVLMSDCASPAWYGNAMYAFLEELAVVAPVTVLQLLPRRHWARTALGGAEVPLNSTLPATPNRWLDVQRPWWLADESPDDSIPMPVTTLQPEALADWVRLVTGAGGGPMNGLLLYRSDPGETDAGEMPSARDRVNAFRAMVSPQAHALAAVFAAASPLTVPVMQLLHRTLFKGDDLVPLAEVFLGQLLRRAPSPAGSSQDEIAYDFDDDVRDVLLDHVDRLQATAMLRIVGDYLAETSDSTTDFRALIADPAGKVHVDEAARPFAEIVRRIRARFDPGAAAGAGVQEIELIRGVTLRAEASLDSAVRHLLFAPDGALIAAASASDRVATFDVGRHSLDARTRHPVAASVRVIVVYTEGKPETRLRNGILDALARQLERRGLTPNVIVEVLQIAPGLDLAAMLRRADIVVPFLTRNYLLGDHGVTQDLAQGRAASDRDGTPLIVPVLFEAPLRFQARFTWDWSKLAESEYTLPRRVNALVDVIARVVDERKRPPTFDPLVALGYAPAEGVITAEQRPLGELGVFRAESPVHDPLELFAATPVVAEFGPSGSLAFGTRNGEVLVSLSGSPSAASVARLESAPRAVRWSPDGRSLAVVYAVLAPTAQPLEVRIVEVPQSGSRGPDEAPVKP